MRGIAAVFVLTACLPSMVAGQTPQREQITAYNIDVAVEQTGSLLITETIAYFFDAERHGILRDITVRLRYDDRYDRAYPLDVVSVDSKDGAPDEYTVEDIGGGMTRIRIGDPKKTIQGAHTYAISYRVRGALNAFPDHDELYWNVVGNAWPVPIGLVTARVGPNADGQRAGTPGWWSAPLEVACFAGPLGSQRTCRTASIDGGQARFAHPALQPYEGLTVVVSLAKGVVPAPSPILEERWSFGRAFAVTPLTVGMAALVLAGVVYGLVRVYWTTGRDLRWAGSPIDAVFGKAGAPETTVAWGDNGPYPAEYIPPEGMRPGLMGTLVDETAHPLDVTVTIIDLASRGYLRIEEILKEGWFGKPDWKLVQLKEGGDLLEYEQLLLDSGLFEDGPEALLSDLKDRFAGRMHTVQEVLYDEAVARGWFTSSPQSQRTRWMLFGMLILVAAVVVEVATAAFTHFGIVPLPLVLGGIVLLVMNKSLPRRTAAGTAALRHVLGFRRFIDDVEDERSRFAEQAHLFYDYLAFAIVFGLTAKWAKAFAGLANAPPPPSWYVSSSAFSVMAFSNSMDNFGVTATGTIASTPSGSGGSGFSGGSSGGGGGGGGGGSW